MLNNDYSKLLAKHIDNLINEFKFNARRHDESKILNSVEVIFDKKKDSSSVLNQKQIGAIRELLTFLSATNHPIIEYTPVTFYVFRDGYDNHDADDVSAAILRARELVDFESSDFSPFCDPDKNTEYKYYKILDHISLAFIQANEMRRLQSLIDETEEKLKTIDSGIDDINKTQKYVEKQVSSIYPQFITILGIFTAIIVAFFGGVSLSNSLISTEIFNTIETLITIGSISAIFILTMLFMLLTWVDHILNKDVLKIKHTEIYYVSIIFLAIIAIVGVIMIFTK